MKFNEMMKMRQEGATYQKIADAAGVSKQWVHHRLTGCAPELKYTRGHGFNIEKIVYKGIYEHFKNDVHESVTSFTKKIYGHDVKNIPTVRLFITGKSNTRFTITQIKRICETVGKPFEEVFAERETKEGANET